MNIIVHGLGAKLVPNSKQNMLYTKRYHFLCRQKISMLTGLKVPSLACKCAFYRPEHKVKGELGLGFWIGIEFRRSWNAEMTYTNG